MEFGHLCLVAAFIVSLAGTLVGTIGAWRRNSQASQASLNALPIVSFFGLASLCGLGYGFLTHDYRFSYVWRTSNNAMPDVYLISAIWGGMDGSMLLWAVLLSLYSTLAMYSIFGRSIFETAPTFLRLYAGGAAHTRIFSWVLPVLHTASLFFYGVVTFLTNPFRYIDSSVVPLDGNGLNPLLQNPSMMIHPPALYLGFTGFVIPFAFAFASLITGESAGRWAVVIRRWTCIAWAFLTAGIILGGNWAYIELGWGGFWAWDPVENASFLPWLTATAYLHSVMVEERRGMLRIWNLVLPILTYALVVFGTFLTRSGVVQSVHAFAESDIGEVFLLYIAGIIAATVVLLIVRRKSFRSENRFEGLLARETLFLLNNLLFLGICFATLWGVMFPVFTEALTGTQSVVGPPFFNAVNVPLFLLLLLLMGIAPVVAWRRMSIRAFLRLSMAPLIAGLLTASVGLWIAPYAPSAALAYGLCVLVVVGVLGEYRRGVKARRTLGLARSYTTLLRSRPRKYGGLLVHVGVAVVVFSITSSMAFKIETDIVLGANERHEVGPYELRLASLEETSIPNYSAIRANIDVFENGQFITTLRPERRFYPRSQETTTEVDIRMTARDDLYLALAGLEDSTVETIGGQDGSATATSSQRAVLKVFVNPMQFWLWVGSMIMLAGTLVVLTGTAIDRFTLVSEHSTAEEVAATLIG